MIRSRSTVLAVMAGAFGSLDTALNIAFPDLVADLDLELTDLQWVVVCYVLTYGALLLPAGQLGDAIGHRRSATIGAAISTAALGVCAAAPSFPLLLVGRVAQGVGVATVMASAPALLTTAADEDDGTGRGVGIFQAAAAAGLAIGPIVGGPLVEFAGWRAVFWFRVPIGIALVLLALRGSGGEQRDSQSVDRFAMVLVSASLGALVLSLNLGGERGWADPVVLAGWVVALVAGVGFVFGTKASPSPIIDVGLFRSVPFAAANVLSVIANGAMFATWLFVPSLLLDEIELSVIVGGVALATSPLATAFVSPRVAGWGQRLGRWRLTVAGLVIESTGMFGLAAAVDSDSVFLVAAGLAAVGLGLGVFTVANMSLVMDALPSTKQGVAGGLSLMTRTIGIVVGVALASALFDSTEPDQGFAGAFQTVFVTCAAVLAIAAAAATFIHPTPEAN